MSLRPHFTLCIALTACALGLLFPVIAQAQPAPAADIQGEVFQGSTLEETAEDLPASPGPHPFAGASARFTFAADPPPAATGVVISEFRLSGPGGSSDEFIELANPTGNAVDLSGWSLSAGTVTTGLSSLDFSGKSIPAWGRLLVTNSGGYSLASCASGDVTYTGDIATTSTLTLSNAANTVVDTVGNLWAIASPSSASAQYSYTRRLESGVPADSGTDSADFNLVDSSVTLSTVDGTGVGPLTGARLGAPGPQNTASRLQSNSGITITPISIPGNGLAGTSVTSEGRYASKNSSIDTKGRLSLRRSIQNSTGSPITSMRFRIVAITGGASTTTGVADIRAISSGGVRYYASDGTTIQQAAWPLAMESPSLPSEAPLTASSGNSGKGGGLGTTWTVALPGGSLAPGASVGVEFLFGIVADGNYRVVVDTEVITAPQPTPTPTVMPTPIPQIDARIRKDDTGTEWTGSDIVDASGQNQQVEHSAVAGQTVTYFVAVKRKVGSVAGPVKVTLPNYSTLAAAGWQARFYQGNGPGAPDITSPLTSASGWSPTLAPGAEVLLRVALTVGTTAQVGERRALIIHALDMGGTGADAVGASVLVEGIPTDSTGPYLQRIEWSFDGVHWQSVGGAIPLLHHESVGLRAVARDPINSPWEQSLIYVPTWTFLDPGHTIPRRQIGEMVWVPAKDIGTLTFSATCGRTLGGSISVAPDPNYDTPEVSP
ncbi:hypothetical protein IAD21_04405 [Abditibacteriota bacterium]|nr:hypothetical protein IAD21_04405 [Abditibacteriota bacterium]